MTTENVVINSGLLIELLNQVVRQNLNEQPQSKTIPKEQYSKLYGVSIDTIRKRIQTGIWQYGNQLLRVEGAGDFVDLEAIDKWVRQSGESCLRE